VPVDCEVYQGSATITIEHLTGEVKPLEAKAGDRVPGGARNLDGRMIVKVFFILFSLLWLVSLFEILMLISIHGISKSGYKGME